MTSTMRCKTALTVLFFACARTCVSAPPTLTLWSVAPLQKLKQTDAPGPSWRLGEARLECARNEWEAVQVVVRASAPTRDLQVAFAALRGPGGTTLTAQHLRVCSLEWVDVNAPFDPEEPSNEPDWRPDPLARVDLDRDRFALEPGQNLVFWLLVGVPPHAPSGPYHGRFAVQLPGGRGAELDVNLRVRDVMLPQRPILQSMVGLSAGGVYKAHGCKTPELREQVVRLYIDEYIRARLSPFLYAPGTMAFNPLPDGRIRWTFEKDADGTLTGEVQMDFAGFDREATRYLDERNAFSAFNIAPYVWTRRKEGGVRHIELRFADAANTPVVYVNDDGSENPLFDRLVVKVFRAIAAHLDERGWLDRAVYYVTDEPAEEETPALKHICTLIRRADRRLRTALTYDPANRPRLAELVDGEGRSLVSIWIPYVSGYREKVAAEQREKGAEYWLYDVKEECLITHSGLRNRGIFWNVWQRNAKGYLYYLSTYWGNDTTPWERPNFLKPNVSYKYRHGDGYFFYPPQRRYNPDPPVLDTLVTTVRWELMREGAEDYDMLRLLQDVTEQARTQGLKAAETGKKALAQARRFAESSVGTVGGASIARLRFKAREEAAGAIPGTGWSFNAKEGWLHHRGGERSDLPMQFTTEAPDGLYDLVLRVYGDPDYRGRAYSAFLIDGHPVRTPASPVSGSVRVHAGTVTVADGVCRFVLSTVPGKAGVIVYGVSLRRSSTTTDADLLSVRTQVYDAIESLQAAMAPRR